MLGFFPCIVVSARSDRWRMHHHIIGGIIALFNHTAPPVKIYLLLVLAGPRTRGTPDFATALYMACPVSTAALTGAQAATLRSHWEVARRSGQRRVGLPSVLNETPPIPGRWYLQTRVFSRIAPVCAALCASPVRDGERRPQAIYPSSCARLRERATSVNPPSYTVPWPAANSTAFWVLQKKII
jgi:hypothetical protein